VTAEDWTAIGTMTLSTSVLGYVGTGAVRLLKTWIREQAQQNTDQRLDERVGKGVIVKPKKTKEN
jgi:hypothetical protein